MPRPRLGIVIPVVTRATPIELRTAAGELVAALEMPPFGVVPPVVHWGDRTFLLTTQSETPLVYVETRTWTAPSDPAERLDGLPHPR